MNKKTKALTTEQYKEIIQTMREGFTGCRPNERVATALVLEEHLLAAIENLCSDYQIEELQNEVYLVGRNKTTNKHIMSTMLTINQAIRQNRSGELFRPAGSLLYSPECIRQNRQRKSFPLGSTSSFSSSKTPLKTQK